MSNDDKVLSTLRRVIDAANIPMTAEEVEAGKKFVLGQISVGEYLQVRHKASQHRGQA